MATGRSNWRFGKATSVASLGMAGRPRLPGPLRVGRAVRGRPGAAGVSRAGPDPARGREEGQEVAHPGLAQRTGQSGGHDRRGAGTQLLDLRPRDDRRLAVHVEDPDRVGPLGADHAGGHAAILQGDGVREIFGIDHGAGLGDIAVDRRRVPVGQVVERGPVSPPWPRILWQPEHLASAPLKIASPRTASPPAVEKGIGGVAAETGAGGGAQGTTCRPAGIGRSVGSPAVRYEARSVAGLPSTPVGIVATSSTGSPVDSSSHSAR